MESPGQGRFAMELRNVDKIFVATAAIRIQNTSHEWADAGQLFSSSPS
jgi:hypothetical protein